MGWIVAIFVFYFGSIIGSFLNVCIDRIPREESIAFPPSHCGNCNTGLKPLDLIPIFSYIFLKGKCRYCGTLVSVQYLFLELITGVAYLLLYFKFGLTLNLLKFTVFTSILIVIAVIDYKTQDVYTSTIIVGVILGIIFIGIEYLYGINKEVFNSILAVVIPGGILYLIVWLTGAMGEGDAEIIFVSGLFLGLKLNLFNLFLSIVIGGIVAIGLMILKKKSGKEAIAFGPYIALSSYLVIFIGQPILNWYFSMLF
ncbi:prepilin peptidase [Clostridium paraputrificum]|uniref:prepilin peptidase n=1 Tax=Clostridium paraputrificum TaxID=29363 RepID=UPI003D34F649